MELGDIIQNMQEIYGIYLFEVCIIQENLAVHMQMLINILWTSIFI